MLKKLIALICSFIMVLSLCVIVSAEAPVLYTTAAERYVEINGNAGSRYAGYDVNIMLIAKTADANSPVAEDIAYIGQTTIAKNGDYTLGFSFDKGSISDYNVILNVAGEVVTPSVTTVSTLSDVLRFELDFSQFGKAVATIQNDKNLKGFHYTVLVAFYGEDGTLLGVKQTKNNVLNKNDATYNYSDIPAGAKTAKAFMWQNMDTLIPLTVASPESVLAEYTNSRRAQMLTIAPGIDETERGFAWFDVPGIEGARIQYAEKESDGDLTTFPEDRAITVAGTCGLVDVSDYDGVIATGGDNQTFIYPHKYSYAKATVTGLDYGKEYVYRVGDMLGWCDGIYEFQTDEDPSAGFEFLLLSDQHAAPSTKAAIDNMWEKALAEAPNASFTIDTGDMVDLPWENDQFETYFSKDKMTSMPLAVVAGPTHDFMNSNYEASLVGYHFNMPNRHATSGAIKNVGSNYWYTYGDVLFIALNHNGRKEANIEYIKEAVEEADKKYPNIKWRILYTHWPFYSVDNSTTQDDFFSEPNSDFIADCGIDLVLFGHTHYYYRTYEMYAGKVVSENSAEKGTTYIGLNTAGGYSGAAPSKVDSIAIADTEATGYNQGNSNYTTYYGTANVSTNASGDSLEINIYRNRHDGITDVITKNEKIDTFTITK